MTKRIQFTQSEIQAMAAMPDVLDTLAKLHEFQQTMSESFGFTSTLMGERAQELRKEAKRLEARYDNGDDEGFTE
jgi:hypothetical protein